MDFCVTTGIKLKDFNTHVSSVTSQIKQASCKIADNKRPIIYLESSRTSKEELAKSIAKKDNINAGLICILSAVEPCKSYDIFKNREKKILELRERFRKCLHIYQYWQDPVFGFMNARIQTWFPFNIQICINGREWLSQMLKDDGIAFQRYDNCFTWLQDIEKAQALMDRQANFDIISELKRISNLLNPLHEIIFNKFKAEYYWSTYQSELATDIMFNSKEILDNLFPVLIHHGITTFQSSDVMRFYDRKTTQNGEIFGQFKGDITSDIKVRQEGARIKHKLNKNSIKAYNKAGNLLRIETTINDPKEFKIFRNKQGENNKADWRTLRRSVVDIKRLAEISQSSNNRYLEALSACNSEEKFKLITQNICKPSELNGRRVRALNPFSKDDSTLLKTLMKGEYLINGFRNKDIRDQIFPHSPETKEESKKRSSNISRKLRMLRAHNLITKTRKTHRYQLTVKARKLITALIAAENASIEEITKLAA
ncbi:MAG: hypothetical protein KKF89_02610 [Nanoarchaeota archaeon]|nr:hypothetical protein [Nanoarchaeota archaeon]